MAKDKKTFIGYTDWIHTFGALENDEAGKLIKHLLAFVNDQNPEPESKLIKVVFEPIKQRLKLDLKSWEKTSQSRSDTGRKGGLAKARRAKQKKQTVAKLPDNDNVLHKEYKERFELFRKTFPGKKNGLEVEFDNFCKKHSDWKDCIPKLLVAVKNEIQDRENRAKKNQFNPEWKNLATWINKRCWEQEFEASEIDRSSLPGYDAKIERAIASYNNQGFGLEPEHKAYLNQFQSA